MLFNLAFQLKCIYLIILNRWITNALQIHVDNAKFWFKNYLRMECRFWSYFLLLRRITYSCTSSADLTWFIRQNFTYRSQHFFNFSTYILEYWISCVEYAQIARSSSMTYALNTWYVLRSKTVFRTFWTIWMECGIRCFFFES